jgi:UDP-4-amino-4,6-dideoxy-N-acetyl-beta-L-altrosamine transaminase
MTIIPYGRQTIVDEDVAAVIEALRSEWLTTGPRVAAFEEALAEYCHSKHAVAVANGTAALHLALMAAKIGSGDTVVTSTNTFLSSANCAEFVGATVDFADIETCTHNIDADTLQHAWRDGVRAVIGVDFAGQPCNWPEIAELARSRGALVIEDASHSVGGSFDRNGARYRIGGHPWADMTTFSFHAIKTLTTGEGGAILTDNDLFAERCHRLRNHGMVRTAGQFQDPVCEIGQWYYEMAEVGFNYRITDFQCALGRRQLESLDRMVQRRADIVARYNGAFRGLSNVKIPLPASFIGPASSIAWHLYVLEIDFAEMGKTRPKVVQELLTRGIATQVNYIPVHLQPYYRHKYGYGIGKCPIAESYYQRCLSLPLYPTLSDADTDRVIEAVTQVLSL